MLDELRIFVKCAECGSFSRAGRALGFSPSSVSRCVDKLESKLAAKLFKRTTRQVTLTDAGQDFLGGARRVLSELDDALATVQAPKKDMQGSLKISVFETFGRLHVCPLVPCFLHQNPNVRIELMLDNQLVDLYRDEFDLAIRIGRPEDSRLKARKLMTNQMQLCASPGYLEKQGVPADPQVLSDHNCLVLNHGRQITWWHFRKHHDYQKVQVSGNVNSIGGTPLLEAARQGIGITMLADWMLAEDIKKGTLVSILPLWQPSLYASGSGDIYAVFLNDRYMKPALRSFIEFLCDQIG